MPSYNDTSWGNDAPGPDTDPTLDDVENADSHDGVRDDNTNYHEPGEGSTFAGQDPSVWDGYGQPDEVTPQTDEIPAIEINWQELRRQQYAAREDIGATNKYESMLKDQEDLKAKQNEIRDELIPFDEEEWELAQNLKLQEDVAAQYLAAKQYNLREELLPWDDEEWEISRNLAEQLKVIEEDLIERQHEAREQLDDEVEIDVADILSRIEMPDSYYDNTDLLYEAREESFFTPVTRPRRAARRSPLLIELQRFIEEYEGEQLDYIFPMEPTTKQRAREAGLSVRLYNRAEELLDAFDALDDDADDYTSGTMDIMTYEGDIDLDSFLEEFNFYDATIEDDL